MSQLNTKEAPAEPSEPPKPSKPSEPLEPPEHQNQGEPPLFSDLRVL